MDKKQQIAIVGIGGVFPGGRNLDDYWDNILNARDLSREPPDGRWLLSPTECFSPGGPQPDKVYSRRACFVDDFDVDLSGLHIKPELVASLDPMFRLLLQAGKNAWHDVNTETIDTSRTGVILGNIALPTEASSALADELILPEIERQLGIDPVTNKPVNKLNRYVAGLPAGMLARSLGLGGGSYTLDAACASSLYALKYAVDELLAGRTDVMLTGGLSRPDPLYTQMGFSALHAISASGHCSPFDQNADGLVVGEGSGILILKRLDDALTAGDHIYATIEGIGLANDIEGNLMSPDSEGQLRAMRSAYDEAGWQPWDVDLIECHGTGTPVGDVTEFNSLCKLWNDSPVDRHCVIGSVKSNIGHLLTAAGSASLIKVLLAMKHDVLPPTANFTRANDKMDLQAGPFSVLEEAKPWHSHRPGLPKRAAISAFGFGGINAHVLIQEWGNEKTTATPTIIRAHESTDSIAIVGMDAHFGSWQGLDAFKKHIYSSADAVATPVQNSWGVDTGISGHGIDQIDIPIGRYRIPPAELGDMLPQQLLMLEVAANAIDDAGIDTSTDLLDTGVYIGIGLDLNTTNYHLRWKLSQQAKQWAKQLNLKLSDDALQQWVEQLQDSISPPLSANRTMGALGGIVASRIARAFNVGGPSFTLSNEEASGLRSVATAVRSLQCGDINCAIVGAVDLASDLRALLGQHDSRPFTSDMAVGDGAAALILKRHKSALADGDHIYGIIKSIGESSDGATHDYNPTAEGYSHAAHRAIKDAGIELHDIAYIESHGSLDKTEANMENSALEHLADRGNNAIPCRIGNVKNKFGHTGAAGGLASMVAATLALQDKIIPPGQQSSPASATESDPLYWLNDREHGPRHALVNSFSVDGNSISAVLAEHPTSKGEDRELFTLPAFFSIEADTRESLLGALDALRSGLPDDNNLHTYARNWNLKHAANKALALSIIANDASNLIQLIADACDHVQANKPCFNSNLFYNPEPAGAETKIAFVFPGSGNHFHGMGQEAACHWPEIIDTLDSENSFLASQFANTLFWTNKTESPLSHKDVIFGQVSLGTMMSDIISSFSIRPDAIIGYSLGETAGLFATRAWVDRDEMLSRIQKSELFTRLLAGPCDAAREVWQLGNDKQVDWSVGVIACASDRVLDMLIGRKHVYLLIINTQQECVIGGKVDAVQELVRDLDCHFHAINGVTTVHCEVAEPVKDAYRNLHLFDTNPPTDITYYSGIFGGAYEVTRNSAADSIVGQALHYFDYPKVINQAYEDGVRFFIEMGPGGTCTRMIDQILEHRPHFAKAMCVKGQSEAINILQVLGRLNTERIPVNFTSLNTGKQPHQAWADTNKISVAVGKPELKIPAPPPGEKDNVVNITSQTMSNEIVADGLMTDIIKQMATTEAAHAEAQKQFLKVANGIHTTMAEALALQAELIQRQPGSQAMFPHSSQPNPVETMIATGINSNSEIDNIAVAPRFDRQQCMEIAIGSIAKVLGPAFAEVDSFPTRVRLPDEPLMLVDRIMEIEGEVCSMTNGRVVTEHDVLPQAWYLDGGRIPTCIAVEAGQADLFLSGYLGIDHITRGQAVYRLLDAEVTFHGPLPQQGETINYDIHIDHFFQQGDTYLFRFYFDGTVKGKPLITMRKGCAGFFTQAELDAGKGIVLTSLEKQLVPGKLPEDWQQPVNMQKESYTSEAIDALRNGDLQSCFGESFANLNLNHAKGLPGNRMTLVHRVLDLNPQGGRFGIGQITGEADIHPDDWFLTCHFVDDQVMPGTLMYECCLHTLRIYLLRMGWVGEADEFVYEPIQEISSKLKCRGQVTAETRKVLYEITLKEIGYQGQEQTPYAIADALMFADGRPVVQMSNMSIQLSGLTRQRIENLWNHPGETTPEKTVLFDYNSIHNFAVGNPSEAFGDRYHVFDKERVIARLPGPPFQFLDRIVAIDGCQPWVLKAGGVIEAEYDIPKDAWYFEQGRQPYMPFAVLLEAALQPCGWLAAYLGSALTSEEDLSFRNLGGEATQYRMLDNESGTLHTEVKITNVSSSGGMIIQHFNYHVRCNKEDVYIGNTYFGFFTKSALADQIGIRDVTPYTPNELEKREAEITPYPEHAPYPDEMLRMVDEVSLFLSDGGPDQLGYIEGVAHVNANDWFYKAHFYQDPVWPGSLGLESFIQLLKIVAVHHFTEATEPDDVVFESMPCEATHNWVYRGQILPTDEKVTVQACITRLDPTTKTVYADGFLTVDGRIIYQMNDFSLRIQGST